MVDILGFGNVNIPDFGIGSGKIVIILSIFLIILAGGVIAYLIYDRKIFNKKIIVFENISGQGYQPILRDRAKLLKLGDGGEEILFLRKKKVYRAAYGRKMGKNTYWFAIGQDGYWYNVVLGDLDAKKGMLDIEPIDRDMRYMHVAIRKNIQERYRKVGTMEKYGVMIMSGFVLLVMLIGMWFLLDKIAEISANSAGAVQAAAETQEATQKVLAALDNILSSGGIRNTGG